ncbi:MAG: clostripain-related cysteine peptidase [Candidatus Thermoplasmatota archaeon]
MTKRLIFYSIALFSIFFILNIVSSENEQNDAGSGRDAGNDISKAVPININVNYDATLKPQSDPVDYFKFSAKANQILQVSVHWEDDSSWGRTIEILSSSGTMVKSIDGTLLELVISSEGTYYLGIKKSSSYYGNNNEFPYWFCVKLIDPPSNFEPQPKRLWTYILYMSADSGLLDGTMYDIDALEQLGSSSKLNILFLFDGPVSGDSKLIYMCPSPNIGMRLIALSQLGAGFMNGMELNMGDPNLAISVIRFAINYLPAEHYAIVFGGHAGGGGGFVKDTEPYDKITTPEITTIFASVKNILGRNFDYVAIDSCWAGSIENYYELSEYVDFATASEPMLRGSPYYEILEKLKDNPYMTPRDLATNQMRIHNDYYSATEYPDNFINAIDLNMLRTELKEKLNRFVDALVNSDHKKIIEIREKTKSASSSNYKDLGHFALLYKNIDGLKKIAGETFTSIKKTVIQEGYNPPEDYYGISIYFPRESHSGYYSDHFGEYKQTKFAMETKWVKLLEYIMIGGIELELGIPKSNLFKLEDVTSAEHYYAVKRRTYSGNDPFVVMIKTSNMDDVKKIGITLMMNAGDTYYHANWNTVATIQPNDNKNNGILVLPKDKMNGEREFKIQLIFKGQVGENLPYSIAAYGEFEKINENNIEQICWASGARKEGRFDKTNEEKYYFVLIPANKKININLKCTSARNNETDFDLYVGLAPPQGIGLPRIYQFDYRGFTIDANETAPMKGSLGPYNNEVKVYILVRAYQGSGNYNLIIGDII